ncbi:hypothetical protein JWZ98_03260 [Methylomonas sp. EFPC1]|uniref:hypothetical protein n=1 Tax=Methylomonas sp. EFPC1 TaxID=2812647 RepID=UPI001967080C|nr:hypothetical protein [Methylomonas sp. EFPC1]QSB01994.1 hypothetical protein JWZ98_03260 [Methylomonas sp. EFPC1]
MNEELIYALDELIKSWGVRGSALCCTTNSANAESDAVGIKQSAGLAVKRCKAELEAVLILSKRTEI